MLIDPRTFRRLCRARRLLTSEEGQALSVRDVARQVGISRFHFIRLFAALFGATPHQLRKRARFARAQRLLARGQSVTEVCMELGLNSPGSFSSAFKQHVGESPAFYQRRARAHVQAEPGCLGLMAFLPETAFAISEKRPEPGA